MAFTVIWYGKAGILDSTLFENERTAKDHATAMFPERNANDGAVAVEVRKDNGVVVFSKASGSK